jgi:hypothetical protein
METLGGGLCNDGQNETETPYTIHHLHVQPCALALEHSFGQTVVALSSSIFLLITLVWYDLHCSIDSASPSPTFLFSR